MRKLSLLIILLFSVVTVQAQWLSQASGFSDPSQGINQIVITDSLTAWGTGFDGPNVLHLQEYTRTTDGGATWVPGNVTAAQSTYEWSCFAAVDDQNAWAMFYDAAVSAQGGIFRTSDGGQSWTQQGYGQIYSAATSFPDVLYFWDVNNGVAVGDPINNEYEIYTTTDGGTSWTPVAGANIPNPTSGEFGLTRSFGVRGNTFWFGTNKGRVFKTTDYGATWSVSSTGTTDAIVSVDFANDNEGWVELSNNSTFVFKSLRRTTDGGATWTNITPAGTFYNASVNGGIAFVPYTAYTLVASGYYINTNTSDTSFGSAYSLDAGNTWVTIDSFAPGGPWHFAVSFLNNTIGYSGDLNFDDVTYGMWKYSGAFVATDIQNVADNYKFKIYPNPSSGLFYFSFDAQNNLPIHARVTNAIGKVVFDKNYKDKSQTWLRSIDLRNFSKGTYFLDLENNGNHQAQKLVVN